MQGLRELEAALLPPSAAVAGTGSGGDGGAGGGVDKADSLPTLDDRFLTEFLKKCAHPLAAQLLDPRSEAVPVCS